MPPHKAAVTVTKNDAKPTTPSESRDKRRPRHRKRVQGGGGVAGVAGQDGKTKDTAIDTEEGTNVEDMLEVMEETAAMALDVALPLDTTHRENHTLNVESRNSLIVPDAHLNDEAIMATLNLIGAYAPGRVRVIHCMLHDKLRRYQTPAKILSKEDLRRYIIMTPCCDGPKAVGDHWTLAVHRPESREVEWYNSVNNTTVNTGPMVKWMNDRCAPAVVDRVVFPTTPQQRNTHDCGVVVCLVALAISLDRDLRANWGDNIVAARLWWDECLLNGVIPDHPLFNAPVKHGVPHSTAPIVVTTTPTGAVRITPSAVPTAGADEADVGDAEDDADEELDAFIEQAVTPSPPNGPPPNYWRAADSTHLPPPSYAQATASTQRVKRQVDPTFPCAACGHQVHGDTVCMRCHTRTHPGCLAFGMCPTCFSVKENEARTHATKPTRDKVVSSKNGNKDRKVTIPETARLTQQANVIIATTADVDLPVAHMDPQTPAPTRPHTHAIERRTKKPPNQVFNVHVHNVAGPTLDFQNGRQVPAPAVTKGAAFLASLELITGPPDPTDLSWKGLSQATRNGHMRMLRLVRISLVQMPDLANLPIPLVCQKVLARTSAALKWKPPTMLKNAATLQGAMARLDQYTTNHVHPIKMQDFSFWADFMRYLTKQDRMHASRIPRAATAAEVHILVSRLIKDGRHALAALTIISWTHAARPGDVWKLTREDITVTQERVTITWRRGKVVSSRGPYSTFAVSGEYHDFLSTFVAPRSAGELLFVREGPWRTNTMLRALRSVSPTLELRSLRRGALQTLSATGVGEDVLMIFSGHASVTTLRRYLGWTPAEEIAARCQVAALALLHTPQMG